MAAPHAGRLHPRSRKRENHHDRDRLPDQGSNKRPCLPTEARGASSVRQVASDILRRGVELRYYELFPQL